MSLGQNIAKLRKFMGLTQEQLAEKCDVSRQAVAKWESGRKRLPFEYSNLIASAIDSQGKHFRNMWTENMK